ncbi:MAG: gliding motility lipoprotein GldD [Flavobacteriaceae bacterium]|nr:gliding motility lipoprotein GldD [Flavobacteriaceae bacterium]
MTKRTFIPSNLFRKEFLILTTALCFLITSCNEETLPKPNAFLRLTYDEANYQKVTSNCPYSFDFSDIAKANLNDKCWINIEYPSLKASLNITYRPIEDNLKELLQESEKLTYKHSIKADGISAQPYENVIKKVYGSLLEVTGNAASPLQFHLTDSVKHFITGALYFEVQPNYDSILPAIKYVEKDMKHLMETLEWKN